MINDSKEAVLLLAVAALLILLVLFTNEVSKSDIQKQEERNHPGCSVTVVSDLRYLPYKHYVYSSIITCLTLDDEETKRSVK